MRLKNNGTVDKDSQTITYRGEEYFAVIKMEEQSQTLKLDKIFLGLEEDKEIILANKNYDSEEYNIIVNNLSKNEFERFKRLFEENLWHESRICLKDEFQEPSQRNIQSSNNLKNEMD